MVLMPTPDIVCMEGVRPYPRAMIQISALDDQRIDSTDYNLSVTDVGDVRNAEQGYFTLQPLIRLKYQIMIRGTVSNHDMEYSIES